MTALIVAAVLALALRLLGRGKTSELNRMITDFQAWVLVVAPRTTA